MASVAAKISKDLAAKKRYPNGTVVRFRWIPSETSFGYNYVAIYIEATNSWYLSGRGPKNVSGGQSSESFLEFLNKCTDIYVATEWEAVE